MCVVLRKAYGGVHRHGLQVDGQRLRAGLAVRGDRGDGGQGGVEILNRRDLASVPETERDAFRHRLESDYEAVHLSPTVALTRGYVDDVIDPAGTRTAVAGALAALAAKRERLRARRHDNIPL